MENIKVNENVEISRVAAGCMRIKEAKLKGQQLLDFVQKCMEIGVTTFDHAPVYGGYQCDQIFGDSVLRMNPKLRQEMQIVTKAGIVLPGAKGNTAIYYNSSKKEIKKETEDSLRRLGTDYIDLLLVHRPDPLADPKETAEALDELIEEGKILAAGVSNFMPSQVRMLQKYMIHPLVVNQVEMSVKTTDNFFNGVSDDALTRGMRLMAWSPLGGGSVFSKQDEQMARLSGVLGQIAEERKVSLDVIMYAWLFRHPAGVIAVTGTTDIRRIKHAVQALSISLTYDEWYRILEASRGFPVP